MFEIEPPDQIAVGLDAIGIVDVGGLQKAQTIRLGRLDHLFQAIGRIGIVADEDDLLDAGLLALVDFKNQIDAIVRPIDDLRHHLDVETPVALIDLDDALGIRLDHRARQRTTLLGLDFLLELLVLQPVIAFEGKPIDDRRLHHRDDHFAAGLGNVDVLEQARRVERLEGSVDLGGVEMLARGHFEIRADGVGFDAAVTLDDNGTRGKASIGRRRDGSTSQ